MTTKVHKVFVSYHHENDQKYRDQFETILQNSGISILKSVQMGDIDPDIQTDTVRRKIRDEYLRDSTVTVVLVGAETWKRKHVDWEIGSSIRHTDYNPRSGLLGILLPTYPLFDKRQYDAHTIPPRLYYNIECKFAEIRPWTTNPTYLQDWIHEAFLRRNTINPDNSYPSFKNNRNGIGWQ
ncbi:MAG: TIR domain-containing protein [Methanoregula sp.]